MEQKKRDLSSPLYARMKWFSQRLFVLKLAVIILMELSAMPRSSLTSFRNRKVLPKEMNQSRQSRQMLCRIQVCRTQIALVLGPRPLLRALMLSSLCHLLPKVQQQ